MDPTIEEQRLLDMHVDRAFSEHSYIVRLTVKDRFIDDDDVAFLDGWILTDIKIIHKVKLDARVVRAYVKKSLQDAIDKGIIPPRRPT